MPARSEHAYTGRRETEEGFVASCMCGHKTRPAVKKETCNDRILSHLETARANEVAQLARKRAAVGRKNIRKAHAANKRSAK